MRVVGNDNLVGTKVGGTPELLLELADGDTVMSSHFRFEQDMIPSVIGALPFVLDRHSSLVWTSEFARRYRVIDVLAACVNDPWQTDADWENIGRALQQLTEQQVMILSEIMRKRRATPQHLARFSWLLLDQIREHLRVFVRLGLVARVSLRSYGITEALLWVPKRTISIEAKLSDWRDALKQAMNNKPAVDYSYVALPLDDFATRHDVLGRFAQHGIGVLGVSSLGNAQVLVQPRRQPIDPCDYGITSLKILSNLLSSSPRWEYMTSAR